MTDTCWYNTYQA